MGKTVHRQAHGLRSSMEGPLRGPGSTLPAGQFEKHSQWEGHSACSLRKPEWGPDTDTDTILSPAEAISLPWASVSSSAKWE